MHQKTLIENKKLFLKTKFKFIDFCISEIRPNTLKARSSWPMSGLLQI